MRKLVMISMLLLAFAGSSFAQKAEFFGGYAWTNLDAGAGEKRVNLNGFDVNLTGYMNPNFGIMGDFSGAYGTPNVAGFDVKTKDHFFLFGPVVKTGSDKAAASAHVLFGGARASGEVAGVTASDNSFAMALGGAVDLGAKTGIAVRVAQFDYILTKFGDTNQHNFRYAAGVVFRF